MNTTSDVLESLLHAVAQSMEEKTKRKKRIPHNSQEWLVSTTVHAIKVAGEGLRAAATSHRTRTHINQIRVLCRSVQCGVGQLVGRWLIYFVQNA